MSLASEGFDPGEEDRAAARRWLIAAAAVVLFHGGPAIWLLGRHADAPADEAPAAVMIDLTPMAVAPQEEAQVQPTEGPVMTEAEPEEEEPVETQVVPELPPVPKAVAVLAPPPKPKPKPVKKKVVEKIHKVEEKPPAPRTSAPAHARAAPGRATAAPSQGAAGAQAAAASWHSRVGSHYARYPRYPGAKREAVGTPLISFRLNRGGGVLSAHVVRSSGSAALDQEAVAAAYRASPFPPAPPEVGGGSFAFTAPVRYH